MVNEIVATRIERAQAGLAESVRSTDGAHFRMLLSLISSNESYGYQRVSEGSFSADPLDDPSPRYIAPEQLYTATTVERINLGLQLGNRGEVAYALAWIDTQANTPRARYAAVPRPDPGTTLSMIA